MSRYQYPVSLSVRYKRIGIGIDMKQFSRIGIGIGMADIGIGEISRLFKAISINNR